MKDHQLSSDRRSYAYDVVWQTNGEMSEPSLRDKRLFAFADCGELALGVLVIQR